MCRRCIRCNEDKGREMFYSSSWRNKIYICKVCSNIKWKTPGIKMRRAFRRVNKGVQIPEGVAHAVAKRCHGLSEISGEDGRLLFVTRRNFEGKVVTEKDIVVIGKKERRMWKDLSEDAQRVRERECAELQQFASGRGDSMFGSSIRSSPSCRSSLSSTSPVIPLSPSPPPPPPPRRTKPSVWDTLNDQQSAAAFAFLMANCDS